MTAQPIGPHAYLAGIERAEPVKPSVPNERAFKLNLEKAVTGDEAAALAQAFGLKPSRPVMQPVAQPESGQDEVVKGRHLDLLA